MYGGIYVCSRTCRQPRKVCLHNENSFRVFALHIASLPPGGRGTACGGRRARKQYYAISYTLCAGSFRHLSVTPPSRREAFVCVRAPLYVRRYIRLFFRVVVGANPYQYFGFPQPLMCGGIYLYFNGRSKIAPTVCMMLCGCRDRRPRRSANARPIFLPCDRTQISW